MNLKNAIQKFFNPDGYWNDRAEFQNSASVQWGAPLSVKDHMGQNSDDGGDFENGYPSIRVIAQKFASIEPYTIDAKGKSVPSNILDRIYTPNNAMSAYDFREVLAVMTLVHNKVFLRVHFKDGTANNPTADNITGFTFLEGAYDHIVGGTLSYWTANGEQLSPKEVMVFKSINPYWLFKGYSPAHAARRWTHLDDLIADYQRGFFDNGTVPSGQFLITAKSKGDFEDIRAQIQQHHRGAAANNGVMFTKRPLDATGAPGQAQIEWVPFAGTNKDLALKDIFDEANKKIDSVYGVPASLRGVNDQNTYASVRVDQQIFNEQTLRPFTLKLWTTFTHELNRITGGTGLAITFDLPEIVVADEQLVRAQATQAQATTITALTTAGYTLASIGEFLESGDPEDLEALPVEDDLPQVDEAGDLKDEPIQPLDPSQPGSDQASKSQKTKALPATTRDAYEAQVHTVAMKYLTAQVEAAKTNTKDATPPTNDDQEMAGELAAILLALVAVGGDIAQEAQAELLFQAGISTGNLTPFALTGAQTAAYKEYLGKVASSYNADTASRIRDILQTAHDQGMPAADIKKQLDGLMDQSWRAERLARTETVRAGNVANQYSMEQITKETAAKVTKTWRTSSSDPCPYCQALDGTTETLSADFVHKGGTVTGTDGSTYSNDWMSVDSGGLHPNCACYVDYEVVA